VKDGEAAAMSKHNDLTVNESKNLLQNALNAAKEMGMVQTGDIAVGVHRILGDSILKIVEIQ
jgi:pyruvate kinase